MNYFRLFGNRGQFKINAVEKANCLSRQYSEIFPALLEKLTLVPGGNPRLVPVSRPVPLLRYYVRVHLVPVTSSGTKRPV